MSDFLGQEVVMTYGAAMVALLLSLFAGGVVAIVVGAVREGRRERAERGRGHALTFIPPSSLPEETGRPALGPARRFTRGDFPRGRSRG